MTAKEDLDQYLMKYLAVFGVYVLSVVWIVEYSGWVETYPLLAFLGILILIVTAVPMLKWVENRYCPIPPEEPVGGNN